jgi:hypothetical protein
MPATAPAANRRAVDSPSNDAGQLEVVLLPDGQVAVSGAEPEPEATWEILGQTWEAGTTMGFLRIELGGASWATLIPRERLARIETGVRVTVRRQSNVRADSLVGWTLFC